MTRRLAGLQTWRSDGVSIGFTRGEADLADVRAICPTTTQHVAAALAGHTVIAVAEHEGRALDLVFAPLLGPDGGIVGATTMIMAPDDDPRAADALRKRLAFEELITDLSTRFVNLAGDSIDGELNAALRGIGEFAEVDRAYMFRLTPDRTGMDNTHEWCAEGIEPQIDNLQGLSLEAVPWWASQIKARKVIHVPVVADMPPEAAADKAVLEEQSVLSVLAIPMVYQDVVMGFVGFDSVRKAKRWPKTDIGLLRIASEIFMGALERARADRERALLQTQLVQARSLENVARLAGGVAHDFNNLLAIILNYAELLKREITEPSPREKLDELFATAQRAAALTRQLLCVGRRDVVDPVPVDVSDVVRTLERLLVQSLGDSVALRLELAADLRIVRVGLPQIEQVIVNLTLNARDALPHGGTVVIRTENAVISAEYAARYIDLQPGEYVRLQIHDDGSGMTPEVASRAFEPFFTTKGALGTGLGLSSVHGIVEQAGGHLAMTTAPGAGTTVDAYFPAREEAAERGDVTALEAQEPQPGRGETILVVDDSSSIRKLVCMHLRNAGYHALEVGTPAEAIAIAAQHAGSIDLLLTDVVMPQMSGRDLAVLLRERFGVTRVRYMSGYDDELIARHGVLERGVRLLPKPFLSSDLLRAVRSSLDDAPEP